MNASATIRANYVRASIMLNQPARPGTWQATQVLESRPVQGGKLDDFKAVDHMEHREQCHQERTSKTVIFDVHSNTDSDRAYIDNRYLARGSFMDLEPEGDTFKQRVGKIFTVFPYRDPVYLVAVIFAMGSLDLVINAFFDLLPRTIPESEFETEETIAVPATVLVGSVFFFAAGIFDTFGALNADRGTLETSKEDLGNIKYTPALIGSPEFKWIPSRAKFLHLALHNLAFQAGLIVLFGGVIFMFAGIVDFPDVIPEESPDFGLVVFGPQVIHGFLFFVANAMLAISEQEKWWRPKVWDAEWQGAFFNTIGGLGFMVAGMELFERDEAGDLKAAISAMVGSWSFLIGSMIRWYAVMEFC